jgi:poly(A) polymerase Pap1
VENISKTLEKLVKFMLEKISKNSHFSRKITKICGGKIKIKINA